MTIATMFDLKHAREESADGQGVHVSAAMGRHCAVLLERACDRIEALERENAAMAKVVEAARTVNRTCDELHIELAEAMVAYDRALAPATSKETP